MVGDELFVLCVFYDIFLDALQYNILTISLLYEFERHEVVVGSEEVERLLFEIVEDVLLTCGFVAHLSEYNLERVVLGDAVLHIAELYIAGIGEVGEFVLWHINVHRLHIIELELKALAYGVVSAQGDCSVRDNITSQARRYLVSKDTLLPFLCLFVHTFVIQLVGLVRSALAPLHHTRIQFVAH